jgi:hypothetical protein
MEVGLVGMAALWVAAILLVACLGNADRHPRSEPPTVDQIVAEAVAEQAEMTERPCYCTPSRWARWRDGAKAGPDKIVGTADDIDLAKDEH